MIDTFLAIAAGVVIGTSGVIIIRVLAGKTAFDRVLAASAAGTHAIALLAIVGFLFARPGFFVDLAITYALLNFLFAVAVSKYLEQRHGDDPTEEKPWTS